jgi:hypothetical protein
MPKFVCPLKGYRRQSRSPTVLDPAVGTEVVRADLGLIGVESLAGVDLAVTLFFQLA